MAADTNFDDNGGSEGAFDGYTDFRFVSRRVAESVDEAISAYALLESLHVENAGADPHDIARARARIVSAAMRLVPEMEAERDDGSKPYDDILTKWQDGDGDDDGYLIRMRDQSLYESNPDWLHDFVTDIRRAAWHIGYLKAGRREDTPDSVDEEVQSVFEGLNS